MSELSKRTSDIIDNAKTQLCTALNSDPQTYEAIQNCRYDN